MAKFCSNCGRPAEDNISFCPDCGYELDGSGAKKSTPSSSEEKYTNGFAIAGFILAFLFAILGLIFSIIGLTNASKHNDSGKGLSIAGIAISILNMILGAYMYSASISLF